MSRTDSQLTPTEITSVKNLTTSLAGKANLSGGNTFTGGQLIDQSGTATGLDIAINGVLSSISSGLQIYSNAVQTTSTRGLFRVRQDNAGSTQNVIEVLNDGTGHLAIFTGVGNVGIGEASPDYRLDVNGSFGITPGIGTTITPVDNGDLVIETTDNTTLTFKLKGSDGTVRSATLTLT